MGAGKDTKTNILILGARGNIGRHITQCFSGHSEINLYLSSHSGEGMADLADSAPHAQAVRVDVTEADTVSSAVADMHRVVVISPDFTDENVATGNLVSALEKSGTLRQVIRVLGLWSGQTEEAVPLWMREINATCWQHLTARRLLRDSALPVTLVNPASRYMQNFRSFMGMTIRDRHLIAYPFPQTVPHIDTRDIAEVIVHLLKQDAQEHIDHEYVLTGSSEDVLSCTEVAELFSEVLGFRVEYRDDPRYLHDTMGEQAALFVNYLRWQQETVGDVLDVNDHVERFLGKGPRKFRDWISENADFFGAD